MQRFANRESIGKKNARKSEVARKTSAWTSVRMNTRIDEERKKLGRKNMTKKRKREKLSGSMAKPR